MVFKRNVVRRMHDHRLWAILLVGFLICGNARNACADTSVPINPEITGAISKFITLNDRHQLHSPAGLAMLTGEASRRWKADSLGYLTPKLDKVILIDDDHAVARIEGIAGDEQGTDLYFYVDKEDGHWKISAMRCLSKTGVFPYVISELAQKAVRTRTEQWMYENLSLTISRDADLISWFHKNRQRLDRLVEQTRLMPKQFISFQDKENPAIANDLFDLRIDGIERDTDTMKFIVGGIQEDDVGFLYCPSKVPFKVSPGEYIWIEPLEDGWYFFKTT